MERWCAVTSERLVMPGRFLEARAVPHSDSPLHDDPPFLHALGMLLMQRYESQPAVDTLVLPRARIVAPTRTRAFYRQLFEPDGRHRPEFVTCASETLGWWIEDSLDTVLHAELGPCHNTTPAFDIMSIIQDNGSDLRLRVVQVKATRDNLQGRCIDALDKFERLERGDYDQQLMAQLSLLARLRDIRLPLPAHELFYDAERHYRVTAVHEQERHTIEILTTFERRIPGAVARRSVRLMQISWNLFWERLARIVYDQLN